MPSETSIEKGEYYGHRSNDFWPIISTIFQETFETYEDKIALLNRHHIALWDVFSACTREKSQDSSIKNGIINNFSQFFEEHPQVRKIIANGKIAYRSLPTNQFDSNTILCSYAPSTSRAYPLRIDKKVALWEPLLS